VLKTYPSTDEDSLRKKLKLIFKKVTPKTAFNKLMSMALTKFIASKRKCINRQVQINSPQTQAKLG
jgi:hypothetical protein